MSKHIMIAADVPLMARSSEATRLVLRLLSRALVLVCSIPMFGACGADQLGTSNWSAASVIAASQKETSRMWMTVGGQRFAIALDGTDAARAFVALVPMSIDMADLNANEKHGDLSRALPTNVIRPGTIHAGDLMLYGSKTLVVFYKTFESSYPYTRIGHINRPAELAKALGGTNARLEFSAN